MIFFGDEVVNRIREIMKKRGITQRELAEETGIAQTTISRIINGKEVNLATAKIIAKALMFPVEHIWPD